MNIGTHSFRTAAVAIVALGLLGAGQAQGQRENVKIFSSGHRLTTMSVDYSPDGEFVATGAQDWVIQIRRRSDLSLVRSLQGHTSYVRDLKYSPNGQLIASLCESYPDYAVRLWRVSDGALLKVFKLTDNGARVSAFGIAFSPDGTKLAISSGTSSVDRPRSIKLFRVTDFGLDKTIPVPETGGSLNDVVYRPNGTEIAVGCEDQAIRMFDVTTGDQIGTASYVSGVFKIAYSADGTKIFGSGDGTVRRFESTGMSFSPELTMSGMVGFVRGLDVSKDGRFVACSDDGTGSGGNMTIFNASTGAQLYRAQQTEGSNGFGVRFSPNSAEVAYCGNSYTTFLNTNTMTSNGQLPLTANPTIGAGTTLSRCAFSPDGLYAGTGSLESKNVAVYRVSDQKLLRTHLGTDIAFSSTGDNYVVAGTTTRRYRTSDGVLLATAAISTNRIDYVGANEVITAENTSSSSKGRILDASTLVLLHTPAAPAFLVSGTRSGNYYASIFRTSVTLYDAATNAILATRTNASSFPWDFKFSPDGRRLAFCNNDAVVVLNTPNLSVAYNNEALFAFGGVDFSADGNRLLTIGSHQIRAIDLATQATVAEHWSGNIGQSLRTTPAGDIGTAATARSKSSPVGTRLKPVPGSAILSSIDRSLINL